MRIPPASVWATFPASDPNHPITHGRALVVINAIFIVLMVVSAGLRFYARFSTKRWFGIDDIMIALGLIFAIGMNAAVILANKKYGWDRHIWALTFDMIEKANIIAFAAKLLFTFAATFTRLSLIFFFYRLIKDTGIRWYRWILHISVAWNVALCITFVCEVIFLCTPVRFYWQLYPTIEGGHCLNEGTVTLTAGIINCVTDFWTTVLPIPLVMRLQMPMKQRLGVCVLLCLGIIVTGAGIVRTYYIWKGFIDTWDETWYSYPLWISAAIEIDLAVICACIPSIKSLIHGPVSRVRSKLSDKLSARKSPNASQTSGQLSSNPSQKGVIDSGNGRDVNKDRHWYQLSRLGSDGKEDSRYADSAIDEHGLLTASAAEVDEEGSGMPYSGGEDAVRTTCYGGPAVARTATHRSASRVEKDAAMPLPPYPADAGDEVATTPGREDGTITKHQTWEVSSSQANLHAVELDATTTTRQVTEESV